MKYTHFGRYLYSFRIKRGFENISDFLERYQLPMSDNYYRDVEAGRKLITLDKAYDLFKVLPFDEKEDKYEFFWHYFKEILPEDVHEHILMPRVDTSFANVKDAQELLRYDLKMHREAAATARFEQTHISSDAEVAAMSENFELMPLVHYIHMVNEASENDIENICNKNAIQASKEDIDNLLQTIGVKIEFNNGEKYYIRSKPIYRIPKTEKGIEFKDRFALSEIKLSFSKNRVPEMFAIDTTFDYSVIVAIPRVAMDKLTERLRDLISELSVSNKQLEDKTATPFFVSIIVSSRTEYKVD